MNTPPDKRQRILDNLRATAGLFEHAPLHDNADVQATWIREAITLIESLAPDKGHSRVLLALDRMIVSVEEDIKAQDSGNHVTLGWLQGELKGLMVARTYTELDRDRDSDDGTKSDTSAPSAIEPTGEVVDLIFAARRVWKKYGHDENGIESDWTEWVDLRDAIAALRDRSPKIFEASSPSHVEAPQEGPSASPDREGQYAPPAVASTPYELPIYQDKRPLETAMPPNIEAHSDCPDQHGACVHGDLDSCPKINYFPTAKRPSTATPNSDFETAKLSLEAAAAKTYAALAERSSKEPMLPALCEALGWQGGTIHQALDEVRRLAKPSATRLPQGFSLKFADNCLWLLWPEGMFNLTHTVGTESILSRRDITKATKLASPDGGAQP